MQQYRNTPGEHELHMLVAKNTSGSTRARGSALVWRGYDTPGELTQPVADRLGFLAGIAWVDMPDQATNNIVKYGFTYALVQNGLVDPILIGDILVPVVGQDYLVRGGASDGKTGFVFAAESYVASNPVVTTLRKVLVKC
jgi:hypothetical protein